MESQVPGTQQQRELGLKERFFQTFHQDVTSLEEQIERLHTILPGSERSKAVDECLAGIDRLSHEVMDASTFLPAYDRRTYGDVRSTIQSILELQKGETKPCQTIKALSDKLQKSRSASAPAKKFQFRSVRKTNPPVPSTNDAQHAQQRKEDMAKSDSGTVNSTDQQFLTKRGNHSLKDRQEEQTESSSNPGSLGISNRNNVHDVLPIPAVQIASSATVTNIHRSIINLSAPMREANAFANVILKDIKSSLIICGQVDGPIHITGVENSVIVVACRQFRMHASSKVDVYLHCSSRPIIEDCENIRFAPLPEAYTTPAIGSSPNQWNQIDDFKWLKLEPSPHFSLVDQSDRVMEDVWRALIDGDHQGSVDNVLEAVNVLP